MTAAPRVLIAATATDDQRIRLDHPPGPVIFTLPQARSFAVRLIALCVETEERR
jgi:hypothetical protein